MARMIPPVCDPTTRSPGERALFELFKSAPGTEDWVVLHSLDLSDHVERVAGEADFVVVVPNLGVAVLEVKAHRHVELRDGVWLMGSGRTPDVRGPFKQASQAMHSLRQFVEKRVHEAKSVPFWSGVVFTEANFQGAPPSPEWQKWQLIDAADLSARGIADCVVGLLRAARRTLDERSGWFRDEPSPPPAIAARLVEVMRPNFEVHESPKQRLKRLEAEVLHYTDEQTRTLDLVAGNERLLVDGPAGTGKTVLAIEAARRAALSGRRVLLLCFNQLLCQKLRDEVAGHANISVNTLHGYMLELADVGPGARDRGFWDRALPDAAVGALLQRTTAPYDTLVLDEAQDIHLAPQLDVLDLSIEGGLSSGQWLAFGDFANQAIFTDGQPSFDGLVASRATALTRIALTQNCRNTESIGQLAQTVGRLTLPYSRILRAGSTVDAELRYHVPADGTAALEAALDDLSREGLAGPDCAVLSARREGAAQRLSNGWQARLTDRPGEGSGKILATTIHRFKGLEAAAIIVADVTDVSSERTRQLLYTASTRAKHRLIVLLPEAERTQMLECLTEGGPRRDR